MTTPGSTPANPLPVKGKYAPVVDIAIRHSSKLGSGGAGVGWMAPDQGPVTSGRVLTRSDKIEVSYFLGEKVTHFMKQFLPNVFFSTKPVRFENLFVGEIALKLYSYEVTSKF